MINFLHTYHPEPLLLEFGAFRIYWYGLFIVSAILAAMAVSLKLAEKHKISKEAVLDSVFYLVIFGIIGARIYHVFLEWGYYAQKPFEIIKIWNGGIAIHGAIIAGLITAYLFCKKRQLPFWQMLAIYAPGVALGQAIGRWGNYFNQELYGLPTDLPWGIPIDPISRSLDHYSSAYFHPTFLYESIGNLAIFAGLIYAHGIFLRKNLDNYEYIVFAYFIVYSILRFSLEFIRIDRTPEFLGLRWPQAASLIIITASVLWIVIKKSKNRQKAAS